MKCCYVSAPGSDGYPLPYPTRTFFFLPVPYPDFFLKTSGFRVVTIHAVLVSDFVNNASHLAPEERDSLKIANTFISAPLPDSEICIKWIWHWSCSFKRSRRSELVSNISS